MRTSPLVLLLLMGCDGGNGGDGGDGGVKCPADATNCQLFQQHAWFVKVDVQSFADAEAYCAGLAGRLPTIEELRTLVVDCPVTAPGGACGVTDACTSKANCYDPVPCVGCGDGGLSVFGDEAPFWSATPDGDDPAKVWYLAYRYNAVDPLVAAERRLSTYCVR